jgi:hypothetical protein
MILILAFSLIISSLDAAPSCNSFPKFFGGSSADTGVYSIDVFNDYLAFGGESFDLSLTVSANGATFSYITLASISMSTKYYWSKVFSQMFD